MPRIIVAISGASSILYAKILLQKLHTLASTYLVISHNAHAVLRSESLDNTPYPQNYEELLALSTQHYMYDDFTAPIASGTFFVDAMVIIPCSMNTLANIAHGITQNLIHRAADVTLKERRKLIIVPRETPLHTIHLQNMCTLSQAGAIIMPPIPALYTQPQTILELYDTFILRLINTLGISTPMPRWREE